MRLKKFMAQCYIAIYPNSKETNIHLLCSKLSVSLTKVVIGLSSSRKISMLKFIKQTGGCSTIIFRFDNCLSLDRHWSTPPKNFCWNQIVQIKELSKSFPRFHIPSEQNPTDLISRGLDVRNLASKKLWGMWKGPPLSILKKTLIKIASNMNDFSQEHYSRELKVPSNLNLSVNKNLIFVLI